MSPSRKPTFPIVAVAAILSTLAGAQKKPAPPVAIPEQPVELKAEPHHTALLENQMARVYHLKLQPNEVTLPHRHTTFFAFVSLRATTIGNEVRGRSPVPTHLAPGELHTSNGGFIVAERNQSSEPADLLIVELPRLEGGGFPEAMNRFRLHDAVFGSLMEYPAVRAYTLTIAAMGMLAAHDEPYDRLMIALSDLTLRDDGTRHSASKLEMKAGEVRWLPRGPAHTTTNFGTAPATFLVFEFN